jgi:hypothetical protein
MASNLIFIVHSPWDALIAPKVMADKMVTIAALGLFSKFVRIHPFPSL